MKPTFGPVRGLRAGFIARVCVLLLLGGVGTESVRAATNTHLFTYANRAALLADGWSFIATTTNGTPRDTEVNSPQGISYDQSAHPGVLRIPVDAGDLWNNLNNTRNSLFRSLPTNWISARLQLSFAPGQNYQQAGLALYQDDDNNLQANFGYNGGVHVSLIREFSGAAFSPVAASVSLTSLYLRLDRELINGDISFLYSADGINWVTLGKNAQALVNPRLCIWVGGSSGGFPGADLRRLDIITTNAAVTTTLLAQPQSLVFNSVAGQPCPTVQKLRVLHSGSDPLNWSLVSSAAWLSATPTNGPATGLLSGGCDVSVNTAGLAAGIYQATLNLAAIGTVGSSFGVNVTLIVNPAQRARISPWRDGRRGALTLWVDDSNGTGYDYLRTNGLTGTYVLWCKGPIPTFATNYFNHGMELGAHTVTHPCFAMDQATIRFEFESNITAVVSATPQTRDQLVSFSWPCGQTTTNEQVVAADYFLTARAGNVNSLEEPTPYDFMLVKSFNSKENDPHTYNPSAPPNPADLKTVVDAAIAQGKWANLVLHGILGDDGAMAYSIGKDIWAATDAAVVKYIIQRDRTVITNYTESPGLIRFDYYRLPIPASNIRSFETAITTNDLVTFQVDITGLAPVIALSLNWIVATNYTMRTNAGSPVVVFNTLISGTPRTVQLVVQSSNAPPFLPVQNNRTIPALTTLRVTNTVVVWPVPEVSLDYSLLNPPAGAQIDAGGIITWTPTLAQSPGTNLLTTVVTANSAPPMSATNSFTVVVTPAEIPPVLPFQPDRTVTVSTTLTVTNTATDAALPLGALSYVLLEAPPGAQVNGQGIITWTPAGSQVNGSSFITTRVADNRAVPLTATNRFMVTVLPPPNITATPMSDGTVVLGWTTVPGQKYRLQYKNSFTDLNWNEMPPDMTADGSWLAVTNAPDASASRFYRLMLVP